VTQIELSYFRSLVDAVDCHVPFLFITAWPAYPVAGQRSTLRWQKQVYSRME
jgi:hypothetical protein